jgi:hypothetical protein
MSKNIMQSRHDEYHKLTRENVLVMEWATSLKTWFLAQ